jgi:hypothetical protein
MGTYDPPTATLAPMRDVQMPDSTHLTHTRRADAPSPPHRPAPQSEQVVELSLRRFAHRVEASPAKVSRN